MKSFQEAALDDGYEKEGKEGHRSGSESITYGKGAIRSPVEAEPAGSRGEEQKAVESVVRIQVVVGGGEGGAELE